MGVQILTDPEYGYQCLYDTVTMWAFGGIFYEDEDPEDFLRFLNNVDARSLTDNQLDTKITEWRNQKDN